MEQPHQTTLTLTEQYRIIADTAPVMIWISGADRLCHFFNAGWLHFTGRSLEEEYGDGWMAGVHPEDIQRYLDVYISAFGAKKEFKAKYRLKRNDGRYCWILIVAVPRYDDAGSFAGYIGSGTDVDDLLEEERLKAGHAISEALRKEQAKNEQLAAANEELMTSNEELTVINDELHEVQHNQVLLNADLEHRVEARTRALSESEMRFRAMVEHAPVAMAVNKGDFLIFESLNQPMIDMIGRGDGVKNKPVIEAIPELLGQPVLKRLLHTYMTGEEWTGYEEPILLMVSGKLQQRYFNLNYRPLWENGKISGILQSAVDVTEQKLSRQHIEKSLQEQRVLNEKLQTINIELETANAVLAKSKARLENSETKLDQIINQLPAPVVVLEGPDQVIMTTNNSLLSFWNKTKEEVYGRPMLEVFPELKDQPFPAQWKHVLRTGEGIANREKPVVFNRPNGAKRLFYVDYYYQPLEDHKGERFAVLATVIDVTDKVQARVAVEEAESKMRQAIESAELGTWSLDVHTLDMVISDRFREIYGLSREDEITADMLIEIVDENYRELIRQSLRGATELNLPCDLEYPIINQVTKKQKWLRATGKMFFDDHGKASYFSGILMDVTERKMDELRKNDFIGMVSHELKTPLTSLSGYIQILHHRATKGNDDFTKGALDKAKSQVKKMTGMINGFLNISRLESGKILVVKQYFNLNELLIELIEEFTFVVASHGFDFTPGLPVIIYADREKIGSVVSNLLSNAVKYSPGGKMVSVNCVVEENKAVVSVSDEGMGIKPQDRSKLFNRYYRVEGKHTENISGFGIGLYLSAEIIHRHEGEIWVESELCKGSTFTFTLPLG